MNIAHLLTGSTTPFELRVQFGPGDKEENPEDNLGMCIRYEQQPCKSSWTVACTPCYEVAHTNPLYIYWKNIIINYCFVNLHSTLCIIYQVCRPCVIKKAYQLSYLFILWRFILALCILNDTILENVGTRCQIIYKHFWSTDKAFLNIDIR